MYATTARARAKIAAILRKEAKAYQKEGETILNEFFKNEDIRMDDAALDKLTRLHGFHTRDELLVAIGNNGLCWAMPTRTCQGKQKQQLEEVPDLLLR